ncbi:MULTISPECIES: hypothetical protein [Streptomyces]|uniref:hypothetical protein n=1 Tax=Streptomyces malaysiensis TaxID=92644 RepID=UPI002030664B|nr:MULTISPECIES: hypothetical protein [Streptomyces]MCM3808304.1 hypothetical protein [Streptomyces sp. DR7-3]
MSPLVRSLSASLGGGMLPRTFAYGTDSRKSFLILLFGGLSCVINGDTVSAVLKQATWLVIAVIVLILVRIARDIAEFRVARRKRQSA